MKVRLLFIVSMLLFFTGCVMFSEKPETSMERQTDVLAESAAHWKIANVGVDFLALQSQDQYGYERVLHLLRINPEYYRFSIEHSSTTPRSVSQWREDIGAVLTINGGYFDELAQSTGFLVTKGESFGAYTLDGANGYTGMFVITESTVDVRYLPENPLALSDIDSSFSGIQSYPMLLLPSARPGLQEDSQKYARRSIVAKDTEGNILFIVTQKGEYTLFEVMQALSDVHLRIETALNLDGGSSTGLSVNLGDFAYDIPSASVPNVIAIFKK